MKCVFFVTGTDTGVGKTVFGALFTRYLKERDQSIIAFKPLCSGGREDALMLCGAMDESISLNKVNPWYFQAPLAPLLAARREKKKVTLAMVLAHIRKFSKEFETILVEGAGGLLSPLGEGFSSRDLIVRLRAQPIVVAPNKLGVVNHILLTLAALPPSIRSQAIIILMSAPTPDSASMTNPSLIRELLPKNQLHLLPWFGKRFDPSSAVRKTSVRRVLAAVAAS